MVEPDLEEGWVGKRPTSRGVSHVGKSQRRVTTPGDPNSHNTATKSGGLRAHPPREEILTYAECGAGKPSC